MPFHVRPAAPADAEGIVSVCSRAYRATYDGLVPESFVERSITDFYNVPRVLSEIAPDPPGWLGYLVAADGDQVVGAAGGGLSGPGIAELHVIYVEPARRNEGIGSGLLDLLLARLREHDATELWASVMENNDLGLPFYRARGFVPVETVQAYGSLPEEQVRTVRMRRPITTNDR